MAPPIPPYIPQTITVHLGYPNEDAPNVTLSFQEYIKNVASSEIYPTWSEEAILANIHAQVSFALNRLYTEFYPSQGYDFDITNSTAIDQSFTYGRPIFSNIDALVNEYFDQYIRRSGFSEPLAAKYCNGTTVTCEGLSQWGSEYLARQGYSWFDILRYYYGDDIEIVTNTPIRGVARSYPGYSLRRGDGPSENVAVIQTALNRISLNYPSIPKVYPVDGIFGPATERAVREFQRVFNLTVDGIVGKETWYKLISLYTGVKRLAELDSEGETIFDRLIEFPDSVRRGQTNPNVVLLQFLINVVASVNPYIPSVPETGTFDQDTYDAVLAFQSIYGLTVDGVVGENTWRALYNSFRSIVDTVFSGDESLSIQTLPYPGAVIKDGDSSSDIRELQQYLNVIAAANPGLAPVNITGVYDGVTKQAVTRYQRAFDIPVTGNVGPITWDSITNSYKNVLSSTLTQPTQFPGTVLRIGDSDYTIS